MTTIPIPLSTETEARLAKLAADLGHSLDDTAHKALMWGVVELERAHAKVDVTMLFCRTQDGRPGVGNA